MTVQNTATMTPASNVLALTLSPARNHVQWGHSPNEHHRFNRRWEVHMLVMLLDKARLHQPLHATELNEHLLSRGQARPLNRSQVQRLVLSLSHWMNEIPNSPWTLKHAPRKASVGPWFLVENTAVSVQIEIDRQGDHPRASGHFGPSGSADLGTPRSNWSAPLIFALDDAPCPPCDEVLVRLALWTQQALAVLEPQQPPATALLDTWQDHPLTAEARIVQQLQGLQWWRQRDNEPLSQLKSHAKQAHEALQGLLPQSQRDPGLPELVRLQGLFNLLMFDANLHAEHVLRQFQHPAPLTLDAHTQARWHQLRAQTGWLQAVRSSSDTEPAAALALHSASALHLESLIYWSTQLAHPGLIREAVALAAHHLSTLHAVGLCHLSAMSAWQRLQSGPC